MKKRIQTNLAGIIILIMLINSSFAQEKEQLQNRFIQFASISAPTGYEDALRTFIMDNLPAGLNMKTDNMGSLIVTICSGEPDLLVLASMDEPGFIISEIREDGYMRVQPTSRAQTPLFNQFHEGHHIEIITESGIVNGIVAIPSSHITRNKPPIMSLEEFIIETGCKSPEDVKALGIRVLDPVAAVKDIARLGSRRIAGPLLSRKFPAFSLLEAVKALPENSGKSIVFAWTAKSASRNSGAMRLANTMNPKNILLIKGFQRQTAGRSGSVQEPVSELDSGVLIAENVVSADRQNPLVYTIFAAATSNNIRLSPSVTGRIAESRNFRSAFIIPLSIPVRYPDSLVEVIDTDDLDQLITLISLAINGL